MNPFNDPRKTESLLGEFEKNRGELNRRMNQLLQNSPKYKTDKRILIIGVIILFLSLLFLSFALFSILESSKIKVLYSEKIINTPIQDITNNITQYMKPEHTAECIKVEGQYSDSYLLSCERLK